MTTDKIKVMIIDDSALVRQVVTQALSQAPGIEVVATAADPLFAVEKLRGNWPDVFILDIEMPRMDGISFLRKIMAERPTPVIICSSLAEDGAQATFDALAAGAVSIITKPKLGLKSFLQDASNDIVQSIRTAAKANMRALKRGARSALATPHQASRPIAESAATLTQTTERLIAIGTSTGGTQALEVILTQLPATCHGIVIVQHMPEKFTAQFADRLNGICQLEVREAKHGDRITPGRALIAPGGRHMQIRRSGAQYHVEVIDGPLVNCHKPSVDVLFRSVAKFAGSNALGIIMTGMGNDGVHGLMDMHEAGARTIAQDENSCVVFGMPKEAIKLGAVDEIVALEKLAGLISRY